MSGNTDRARQGSSALETSPAASETGRQNESAPPGPGRGRVAADCPKVVNAVIASYQEFLEETYRNSNAETLALIAQERKMVEKDIEARQAAYQKFLAEKPPLWKGLDRNTAQQDRLFRIDEKLAGFRLRRAEIEASIESLRSALRSGRNPAVLVGRMSSPAGNADTGPPTLPSQQQAWFVEHKPRVSPEEELLSLYVQEAKVLAVRGADHHEAVAARKQIDNVRRLLQPVLAKEGGPGDRAARVRELGALKLALFEQELEDLKVAERSLTQLFAAEQQGVRAAALHASQDEAHRKGIERDQLLYDSVLQRLKEVSSVKDFGGYNAQVISPPKPGELAVRKCLLLLGLSLFIGLLGGIGWAYQGELSSRRAAASASPVALKASA